MSIYDEFFNYNQPCPETIPDCQKLREEYKIALDAIEHDPNCNGCKALNLKAEYMTLVWKSYLSNLGLNV